MSRTIGTRRGGRLASQLADSKTREDMMRCFTMIAGVLLATSALAADAQHQIVSGNDAVQWMPAPPGLPKAIQFALLSGDPGSQGPFVIRLKTPANFAIPAHHHPTDEAVTVISGEFQV